MKRLAVVFLMVMLAGAHLGVLAQNSPRKCLTDELHHVLKQQYPDGVPGRTEPLPESTEKTDDFDLTYVIPVVVHIMHNNGPVLLVNDFQVRSQIDVLNEDYGRYGAGANTHPDGAKVNIRFCLASVDPDGNPTSGVNTVLYPPTVDIDPFNEDTLLKRVIQWDPDRYLNVWVVRKIANGRISGYAYFPDEVAGTIYDGFVVDYRFFGRGGGAATEKGRTGTHEVGHFLGLLHPWGLEENLCNTDDDECDDTPAVGREYYADFPTCIHPDGCNPGEERMIENYMDYSDDRCMNIFTNCQAEKMRTAFRRYRSQLTSSENLALTGCGEILDTVAVTGDIVVFPNPTSDVIMVYADRSDVSSSEITVIDARGRRVYFKENAGVGRGPIPIDVSKFNMGLYHVIVRAGDEYQQKSILIRR